LRKSCSVSEMESGNIFQVGLEGFEFLYAQLEANPTCLMAFIPQACKNPLMIVTVGGGDKLHVLRVACYQSPDHINLLQGQLHGIQVLRAAWSVC
jgi:hypothetical protein